MSSRLLIATRNPGKVVELAELLAMDTVGVVSLGDLGIDHDVEETGSTFTENANLKASVYASRMNLITIADDSGLVVDALGGAPGVYSARYAGPNANDADRIEKILSELGKVPGEARTARFVCAISVADSAGNILFSGEGVCEGRIAMEPRGAGGFGYDPIFVPAGFDRTFGELPAEIKAEISHRAMAARLVVRFLRGFFGVST